jgi:hypothetical protein
MRRTVAVAAIGCLPVLALSMRTPNAATPNAGPTRLLRMPTVSANAIAFRVRQQHLDG